MGGIWQAKINRENKPIRDILKQTKLEGDGSLTEAMGALSKEYKNSLDRFAQEKEFFMEQLTLYRQEILDLRREIDAKNAEILQLERIVARHEATLNKRKGHDHNEHAS